MFFFFKQKTAYEMRISDWSSDVCSSDLRQFLKLPDGGWGGDTPNLTVDLAATPTLTGLDPKTHFYRPQNSPKATPTLTRLDPKTHFSGRSEEHMSELQSLMRISSAVFCLKKKKTTSHNITNDHTQ